MPTMRHMMRHMQSLPDLGAQPLQSRPLHPKPVFGLMGHAHFQVSVAMFSFIKRPVFAGFSIYGQQFAVIFRHKVIAGQIFGHAGVPHPHQFRHALQGGMQSHFAHRPLHFGHRPFMTTLAYIDQPIS